MTEENKRGNIKNELDRASKAMDAANLLFDNGFLHDAVSRLYYFLLYNIRALLLSKGLEPKSHEGALRVFSLHFVKEGIFEAKDSHIFSKLMKYREEADYNPSYIFTRDDFLEFKKEAEYLSEKIKAYLKEKGYL
ncbi:MAG: HEPN domain-containing protein [Nitrospirota bacterium]|nr:HEPN domain-containing protein [Nitrospirota bacterium]